MTDPVATPVTAPSPPAQKPAPPDITAVLNEGAQRPWWRRATVWVIAAGVAAVLAGGWIWWARASRAAAVSYTTEAVAKGDLTLTVTANGTIQPTRSINIGSELSGTVLKVNVDVNDRVKKGQVLVVLDPAKLQDQVLRSRAALAGAQAAVVQSAATVAESRANLARLEAVARVSGGKVPSQAELSTARATLERARGAETSARASVDDAKAAASTDQINLSKSSIIAPADGVVLTRSVDPGNAVAASLQAVTLFTLAEDLSRLRVWVYVDEADVGAVKTGQDATFTVSAYPTRSFPASVTRVGFGSTITDNVVTYLTYLDVANADLSLRPGMTATASIIADRRRDVLLVPNAALRFTPTAADAAAVSPKSGVLSGLAPRLPGGPPRRSAAAAASTAGAKRVWVLPKDGQGAPVAVAVTPGISDGHMTEITGGDLTVGMRVITNQKLAVK